jgi:polar amino acid transport system substrate-binding protein
MRRGIGWTAWCLAGLLTWAAVAGEREQTPRRLLIVADEWPPFFFLQDGRPSGVDAEVTERVLGKLGVPYQIRVYPWPRAWLMLQKGKADAAFDVSYQPQRESDLLFTEEQKTFPDTGRLPEDYMWLSEYVFFVNRRYRESLRFESFEQLRREGYTIGLNAGVTYTPDFLREMEQQTVVYHNHPRDSLAALQQGALDLFACDKVVALALARQMGLADHIVCLPEVLFVKPYLTVFARHSNYPDLAGLMSRYNAEVRALRESGEFQRIWDRYVGPETGGERRLLFVCESWRPFEYYDDGRVVGIDAEITARIMARLGLPYEIRIYPFARAWMMIEKGAADAVFSVSYAPERESAVFYTEEQRAYSRNGILPRDYLWISEYVFFAKTKNLPRLKFDSFEQVRADGYRVGVNQGYTYCNEFLAAIKAARTYVDTRAGFDGLIRDEIDLYPMDRTVGLAHLAESGLLASVSALPRPLVSKPYHVLFSRRSDYPQIEQVMRSFYAELRRMRETGEHQAVLDAHYPVPSEP